MVCMYVYFLAVTGLPLFASVWLSLCIYEELDSLAVNALGMRSWELNNVHQSSDVKIYYLELLRASEGTLRRWSQLHLQSLAPINLHWGGGINRLMMMHKHNITTVFPWKCRQRYSKIYPLLSSTPTLDVPWMYPLNLSWRNGWLLYEECGVVYYQTTSVHILSQASRSPPIESPRRVCLVWILYSVSKNTN
jgi:hypothetical protein